MLSRHHTLPDREAFEAASPNVRDILLWWSTRADVAPWQRDRAMEALAYWYDAEIGAHWVAALSSADVEELMKHRIVRHLARHDAAAARPWLEQWLQEDDVQRRLTAVAALEALSPGMARALAEARLRVEVHELVRERLAPFVR